MINVAMVGYKRFQRLQLEGDIVLWMPKKMEGTRDLHFCHVDVVEDRQGADIGESVREMLGTKPDVLHYANYRDPYNEGEADQEYLREVLRRSSLPALLTSALPDAQDLANKLGISYLFVPFNFEDYAGRIKELAQKDGQNSLP